MSHSTSFVVSSAILVVILSLTGCAAPLTSDHYNAAETRTAADVNFGKIVHLSTVALNGNNSGLGASAGGGLGAIAGSTNGIGIKSIASAAAGGILGSMLGSASEEAATRKTGIELIIQLDGGRAIAVVQEKSNVIYKLGQRVRVMTMGGTTRVTIDETTMLTQ